MDAVLIRLLESVARPVALAIANSLWQGAIIAGLVGAALSLLRRRSALARYVVACVGLLAILTTTVATGKTAPRRRRRWSRPRLTGGGSARLG